LVVITALQWSLRCSAVQLNRRSRGLLKGYDMKRKRFFITALIIVTAGITAVSCKGKVDSEGRDFYKIDVYTQLGNYAGLQVGWFAKIVKDKFNMELNIIPTADGVFQTRMASGKLGDLVIFGNDGAEFMDAIEANMLLDWYQGDLLEKYGPDIKANLSRALKQNADVFGGGTKCYGFGYDVSSSAEYTDSAFYHPDIRFDLYRKIGSPKIPNLMGYLDVLKKMVDTEPLSDSGFPAYAISLFKDWDGDTVMSVKCMGAFYGYDEFGFTLYNVATNTVQPIFDRNSLYLQGLQFFNKACQMGILDPDSATQTFSDVIEKYADGRVYWSLFSWLGPANYNTAERLAQGKGMFAVAAEDQKNIVYGTSIYGKNRIWSIGSKAKKPERIMELINWLCTPEGIMMHHWGPRGVTWDYDENNKAYLTPLGIEIQDGNKKAQMPKSAGGGQYTDGENNMNNTTITISDINPITGEKYNKDFWSSELNRETNNARNAWRQAMGALTEDEYLENGKFKVLVVASDFVRAARNDDLEQKYVQVSAVIKNGSWRAIYAGSDEEFNRIVQEMITQARSFGYDECLAWDIEQGKIRAAAVKRALGD
jgi:multiple sugar transport system substrate-binding protein/putative aldouronate transport system substrate-binding protein